MTHGIAQHVSLPRSQVSVCIPEPLLTAIAPGLALYRALLRLGPRVPIPDKIATALGPENPIRALTRRAFYRNKKELSPRLVVSALKNGYRFLTLLDAAANPAANPRQHAEVISFLNKNNTRILRDRTAKAANTPPPPPPPERPPLVPLLTRIKEATPMSPPVYASTLRPRPLGELKGGRRTIPHLDEHMGVPFLRFSKPTPPALSTMLRNKANNRQRRIFKMVEIRETLMPEAVEEDRWEDIVARELARQGLPCERDGPDESYKGVMRQVEREISRGVNREAEDFVARGNALWKIVEEEKRLAKHEAAQLKAEGKTLPPRKPKWGFYKTVFKRREKDPRVL
ncbi:hypothetical protein B0T25DRAFT_582704 [Lasiosphaeria hispida]|uniref:Uncharacterized protein n=1 Tax=Lasiosphaeria hispida TaxID=260671 RepID=A0AAJ0HFJ4_9PEZI|nr:hypothetical protein B0T25DRAFT_582704 [Lasiosphaeria hispida]